MTFLPEPDECGGEADEAQVAAGKLVKAGTDTAIVLELADEGLDQETLAVEVSIVVALLLLIRAWWDDWFGTTGFNGLNEVFGVVAFVSNDEVTGVAGNQLGGLGDVMALRTCQPEAQWVAQFIDRDVNLGAEPASTPA